MQSGIEQSDHSWWVEEVWVNAFDTSGEKKENKS